MPTVDEARFAQTSLGATLRAGVDAISYSQSVMFTRYLRVVLPIDGFVFWVNASILTPGAAFNMSTFNAVALDANPILETPAPTIIAQGSLHYAIERRQQEADNISVNRVIFTSDQRVENLDQVGPHCLYIAEFEGLRFAFSQRGSYYRQADLHHYVGDALYPDMETQVIDNPGQLDTLHPIVSNSLPVWLSLSAPYTPFYGVGNPWVQFYPSYLTPPNLVPPYGVIHIEPGDTRALQSAPRLNKTFDHTQFAADKVRMTLVGLRNGLAMDVFDCVMQYMDDYRWIGLMNEPIIRDEKRIQDELGILAQRKTIDFEVSYWQHHMRKIARQTIAQAIASITPLQPVFAS